MKDLLSQRIYITFNGEETYLQYNTFPSALYLDHYNLSIENIGADNDEKMTIMHFLRAGLIEANWDKNKEVIDRGNIEEIYPSLSDITRALTPDENSDTTVDEIYEQLTTQIIDGLMKSLPDPAVGTMPNKSKKKRTGFIFRLFGAIFSGNQKKAL